MTGVLREYRSFGRPVRLMVLNQFTINLGFYMLSRTSRCTCRANSRWPGGWSG